MVKSKINRFISMASAAACMTACISFTSVTDISVSEAVEVKTAFEITEDMGLGWNLGNSFDAFNGNLDKMGLEAETCWGNPVTTNEMLDAVQAKGFNTIRVPVTWFQHVDENYTIDAAWLARVKEVVDHCYNNGMYVILNLHHEEPYQNRSTLGDDYAEISDYVTTLWGQLADTFKDYDQHLIFETMNEPRATNTDHEWWGPTQSEVDAINKINADALDVIRNAGGNNSVRLVMMPGYCASSDTSIMSKVVIPDDDFVAASVHAYSPYNFAMDSTYTAHDTFTEANRNELINIMDGIRKTFSDNDIPVVLGEYSSSNFDNTDARCEWAEAYISTTKAYGFPCVLWDNNVEANNGGEAHGYLRRSDCTWYSASEPVVDTLVKTLNDSSIVWGSERKSPTITHDDLSTGKKISSGSASLDASTDNNCSPAILIKWSDLEGKDVAVKFTGEVPVLAFMDSAWDNWTEVKPYDVDETNGIAYYSSAHISAAWGEDNLSELSSILTRTNGVTTVEEIVLIGGGTVSDPPAEDNTKSYDVTISGDSMTFIVQGTPGTTANGCLGYMGADWEMIEWEGTIGANGILEVTIDTSDVTAKAGQFQIWWSDDKSAELVTNPEGTVTTQTTTAVELPDTTTTTVEITTEVVTEVIPTAEKTGDANDDGLIDLADAVAIIQHIGNQDRYGLSGKGLGNADTNGDGAVTGIDAIIIQKIEAGIYTVDQLPIKAS